MKKHILTILAIGFILTVMFASVQTVYADDGPEGCIAFTSKEPFAVSLGDHITWGKGYESGLIQFSKTGTDWQEYTAGTEVEAASFDDGYRVFFRGEGNASLSYGYYEGATSSFKLSGSESISCSGNIENLLDHTKVESGNHPITDKYAFVDLFSGCTSLTKAPELPAEKLTEYCYYCMFKDCTGLKAAPELRAATLANNCYGYMFEGCTGLITAPELPATTLAKYCYEFMFKGCTGLNTAPALSATTLANNCYQDMFADCTGLTTAPDLPATTLTYACYAGMFSNCTGLTEAPELPAMTLADGCYGSMFSNCTGLTEAPELPAEELTTNCYAGMFSNCTGLTKAPELPAMTLASGCYYQMFKDCTGLTASPELPATTLADGCYKLMFWSCGNLTTAPELPATTMAADCYMYMFWACESLTEAPELPAMTLADGCYSAMFAGCPSLTEPPELPATTLADHCYSGMFAYCASLTVPPVLPAKTLVDECYHNMFMGSGVKVSTEKGIAEGVFYGIPYRIPEKGDGIDAQYALDTMFSETGGTFKETPVLNKIYYLAVPDWTGSGTEEEPYVISDSKGWNTLATMVKVGYSTEGLFFRLGGDIEVTAMVGANGKPFSGSFDGDGHTLTFNAENAPQYCAPFAYTKDAVFRNLHIAGTIKTKQKYAAGLIGSLDGTVKVTNCRSSMIIDSGLKMVNGKAVDGFHGGFIAAGKKNGAAEFEGCVFDGQLLGPGTKSCGGFIGLANSTDKTYTIKDCIFAPQGLALAPRELAQEQVLFNFIRCAPEMKNVTIQNSYYTETIDDKSQGKHIRFLKANEGITIVKEKAKEYDVSKITFYETGLVLGNTFYAGEDDKITVNIPSVCDGITASAGTLAGEGTAFILTMPDQDVTLTLNKGAYHIWGKATYTWNEDNSKVKAERTCTRDGCGAAEEETVSVTSEVTKDPTCLAKGETTYTSEVFENKAFEVQEKTLENVQALGHKWKEATCTEPKTCTVCSATEGEALGHDWSPWKPLDENQHQRVCGNDPAHTEEGEHAWDEGVVTKEPTTAETGEKTFTCGICQATRIEVIPKKDIDPSDEPSDDTPVDPEIPVIDAARISTVGNFARKEMKIVFQADAGVTNYRIQYRMAGETDWKDGWIAGTDAYLIRNLDKASLCEFRICGFVKLADGSWVRSEWSDIAYRYMQAVKVKSAKAGKGRLKVTWKKDKKATGYQIKYFTDKKIHMADADTIFVKGKAKTKYTIKKLPKGTYYVKVRPVKVVDGKEYLGILKNTRKARVK